jgi:general secretion pathway protein K
MKRPAPQRGVILISAMIIMALAAVVAAALFFDSSLAARRAEGNFNFEQALHLAQGAEALAARALADDKDETDTPADSWAEQVGAVEVEPGVTIEARLIDLSGRFNLNSLVSADGTTNENAHKVFSRLLELAGLDTRWADMVVDLIDPGTQPGPDGGEDSLYLSQTPPHRAGNLTLTSVSELLQMPGFTGEMYRKLNPHVAALPPTARTINVCMASGVVLDALFALHETDLRHEEYSKLTQEEMDERRAAGGCYPRRSVLTSGQLAMQQMVAERSSWFRLESWITVGTSQFALYSLMQRDGGGQVRAITRSLGSE